MHKLNYKEKDKFTKIAIQKYCRQLPSQVKKRMVLERNLEQFHRELCEKKLGTNGRAFIMVFGKRLARRCLAQSKQNKRQCKNAAVKNMSVCKFHGGMSTGARTKIGREKCAEAKRRYTPYQETRAQRWENRKASYRLKELKRLGQLIGLF